MAEEAAVPGCCGNVPALAAKEKLTAAQKSGTYESVEAPSCAQHICTLGPFACICYTFKGIPFSGTFGGEAPCCGPNYYIFAGGPDMAFEAEGKSMVNSWCGCPADRGIKKTKEGDTSGAPASEEMTV